MSDSRDLDAANFARHMRRRRGEHEPIARARCESFRIAEPSSIGPNWCVLLRVSEAHPWHAEVVSDCFDPLGHAYSSGEDNELRGWWAFRIFCFTEQDAETMRAELRDRSAEVLEEHDDKHGNGE